MHRRLTHVLCLLLLGGCAYPPPQVPYTTAQSIPALEYAVISYGNEMERDAQLFLLDARACFDVNGFLTIVMHFRTQRLVDLCEGRDLIVQLVEGFLGRINTDETIICSLNPFPITADRLRINIEFQSFYARFIDPLYMGRIALERGTVYYFSHDSLDRDTMYWKQRIEPYDKALRFSRFRNEDLNQFPKDPSECTGKKTYGPRHVDRSKEHYDHVISRCVSEPFGLSEPAESMGECNSFTQGQQCLPMPHEPNCQ